MGLREARPLDGLVIREFRRACWHLREGVTARRGLMTMWGRWVAIGGIVALAVAGTAIGSPAIRAIGPAQAYDFDGDGFADLAVGVPGEDIGFRSGAGAVNVIYGSATGLTEVGDQFWAQESVGVPGASEPGDHFGSPASGDFDGDGYADLAVGVPGEAIGSVGQA